MPEQPDRNGEQPHQPAHALDGLAAARERELPALLQRGRKREADRREESEERRQAGIRSHPPDLRFTPSR